MAKKQSAKRAARPAASQSSLERYRGLLSAEDFVALMAALAQPLPQGLALVMAISWLASS